MKMIVMRGVSGAGKSTKAKELVKKWKGTSTNFTTYICSADKFFIWSRTLSAGSKHARCLMNWQNGTEMQL